MYAARFNIPYARLSKIQSGPAVAQVRFADKVEREVKPRVQREVNLRLGKEPGSALAPFKFSTDKSRAFYFAKFRGRIPYRRTHLLVRSWRVDFDRRLTKGQLIIRNIDPAAGWVYGPGNPLSNYRQVPGHRNTGWGQFLQRDLDMIVRFTRNWLDDAWQQSVKESLQ